ncbi:nectin-3-like protein [Nothobranchius furzeri]|uniref:Nectin cell adhesion molecule 3 n=1 Tax=Nothobranchius furzeri TaxID=105023 RepID=A0A1A7ZXF2_NOTFU|nr:nectin-3-like protein [Nothobranchius furzeri]KAF7218436.1 nectin-3-like protein [Nothobranchius furzeri]
MEDRNTHRGSLTNGIWLVTFLLILDRLTDGVSGNRVVVPEKVNAVLGKNITLGCRIEVGPNQSFTQISWERRLPSGPITLAVFNPEYGTSYSTDYGKRISFVSPSTQDATITLEGVSFADIGSYICKVSTFPLGNTQASTVVNVLVEPKVYVSAGPAALLDKDDESLVATCIAERGRPAAEVFWEAELYGRSEKQSQDESDGTTTVQVRYLWPPQSYAQGKTLTCVVRHPALQTEFRIPFKLNVQYAPEISVEGLDRELYVGQANVKLTCGAKANPPVRFITWSRVDGSVPDGVDVSNSTLTFRRRLLRNDSAIYRCEVMNEMGYRSLDVNFWVQDPPPTTAAPSTTASLLWDTSRTDAAVDQKRALFTSPTSGAIAESSLGTIVGGAVGGVLFLILLLILGGVCFMRQRRTFRGDYYTKQYLGPSDMQKETQVDVLQPHELQEVYGDKISKGSQELKPKLGGDIIYPDYTPERKDRDDWADRGDGHRGSKEGNYYTDHYNTQNMHPCGPPVHSSIMNNGSPYLPEDCYDNGTDSDYVSHMDGSVISRREWYV